MFSKTFLKGAAAVLMALPLAGCGWFSSSDPHEPAELQDFKPAVTAKISWSADVGENSGFLTPAVTDNAVYAAGGDELVRLDRGTGSRVWSAKTEGSVTAGVGSDGSYAAVVSTEGGLEVFSPEGKRLWKEALTAETDVPPLVGHGLVVVRTADTRVTAFEASSGKVIWRYQGQAPSLSLQAFKQMSWSPAGILIGEANGRLLALGPQGKPVFDLLVAQAHGITEVERLSDVVGRAWVDPKMMCASAFQGGIMCMDASNGRQLWRAKVDAVSGPVSDTQFVYVVDADSRVHAFNRQNGREAWVNDELLYRRVSAPIRIGSTVAVADYEGYVTLMHPDTGRVVGRTRLDGAVRSAPQQSSYGAVFETAEGQVAYVLQDTLE